MVMFMLYELCAAIPYPGYIITGNSIYASVMLQVKSNAVRLHAYYYT